MLHIAPDEDIDATKMRGTSWAPPVLFANGIVVPIPLMR